LYPTILFIVTYVEALGGLVKEHKEKSPKIYFCPNGGLLKIHYGQHGRYTNVNITLILFKIDTKFKRLVTHDIMANMENDLEMTLKFFQGQITVNIYFKRHFNTFMEPESK
jgi:hypothetical protein